VPERPAGDNQTAPLHPNTTGDAEAITSGRVYITGEVRKPGPYTLKEKMTVLDLISRAGGVGDYAKVEKIVIVRSVDGKAVMFKVNYPEVLKQQKLEQNIELKPGDSVLVP